MLLRCSRPERSEALLSVEDGGALVRGRLQAEIELGGVVGWVEPIVSRPASGPSCPGPSCRTNSQIRDSYRKDGIAAEIFIGTVKDMGRDRLVPVGRHDEVDVGGRQAWRPVACSMRADRAVGRDRVIDRQHGADQVATLGVGAELAAHVQFAVEARVLRIVKPARLRLPDVEDGAGDRLAVEVQHPAADQRRCSGLVAPGDIAAGRQIGRAQPVKRPENRRFRSPRRVFGG